MSIANKYGSKMESFVAADLYNLPMPVLPPADLTILTSAFVPSFLFFKTRTGLKVSGFSPTDNAYVRGIALTANLADGLVPFAVATDATTGWNILLSPQLFAAPISNVTNAAGTPTMTTGGGQFETYLSAGARIMWLDDNQRVRTALVSSVAAGGNTLTLSGNTVNAGMLTGSTNGKAIYVLIKAAGSTTNIPFLQMNVMNQYSFFAWQAATVYASRGKITVTTGSTALAGIGTSFTTDYVQSQPIAWTDDSGARRTGIVNTINSDTSITLMAAALSAATNAAILDINSFVALKTEMAHDFGAYTITIDPLFGNGTRRLMIGLLADVEHTFDMPAVGDL